MIKAAIAIVLAGAGLLFLLAAGVMGSSRTAPAPITGADARSGPFVKAYGNIIQHVEYGVTPESVAATSDGGYVALALTDSPERYQRQLDRETLPVWSSAMAERGRVRKRRAGGLWFRRLRPA